MKRIVKRAAVATVVALAWPENSVLAGTCAPSDLSSFSRLGQVVAEARASEPGKLLAAWLLQPRDGSKCEFVYRIDLLLQNGQIRSMNFDARTLDRIEISDDRDWVEAGVRGESGEASGDGGAGSSSGSAENDDDDKDDKDDKDDDNSGRGSRNSGSSDDDGGDDSSGSGSGGDDDGGDDSSGSGSGGDDSSGSGSSGSGSGGDDSSGSGSGDD